MEALEGVGGEGADDLASLPARLDQARASLRDPKSALQEWAQGRGLATPVYRLDGQTGPDHAPRFLVAVAVGKLAEAEGEGASKQAAENAAAAAMLDRLIQEEMK